MKYILTPEQVPALSSEDLEHHIRQAKKYPAEYEELKKSLADEFTIREPTVQYSCSRCSSNEYEEAELHGSGGALSAVFELSNQKYRAITCKRCKRTEFFKGQAGGAQQIADLLWQ